MSAWDSVPAKALRFVLFIPLGFLVLSILQAIPQWCLAWLASKPFEWNWLSVVLALILGSVALWLLSLFFMALAMLPYYICAVLAPWPRPCSCIFGTLFVLFQIMFMASAYREGVPWFMMLYHLLFLVGVICGLVGAYRSTESNEVPGLESA